MDESWSELGFVRESTRLSRFFALLLGVLYGLTTLLPRTKEALALVPGSTLWGRFYLWNLVTGGFVESSLVWLVVVTVVLLECARRLEPLWGSLEFFRFVVLVNICSSLSIWFGCLAVLIWTEWEPIWYDVPFGGFEGAAVALLVALKQLFPESPIAPSWLSTSVRFKHAPSLAVLLVSLMAPFRLFPPTSLPYVYFGLLWSWLYLRFVQKREDMIVGDLGNPDLSAASFFPECVQPPVEAVAGVVFSLVAATRLCERAIASSSLRAAPVPTTSKVRPTSFSTEANRWRLRAEKELEERLRQMELEADQDSDGELAAGGFAGKRPMQSDSDAESSDVLRV